MPWDPPDDAVDLGHGWLVVFQVEVPCEKVDPEDWGTCAIVGHGPGHFDIIITADRTAGNVVGLMFWHTDRLGNACKNGLSFANVASLEPGRTIQSAGHTLEQLDPLHVEASILCKAIAADGHSCDGHGWVRDGRWVPA